MIKFFQGIYTIYSALIFVLLLLVLGLFIVLPILLFERGDKFSIRLIRIWAKVWAGLSGIKFEIHGREKLSFDQPYIYIFNHRSFVDAPVIPIAVPQPIRALGKKELSKIPFFGWVVGKLAVWVDRSSPESRKESLEKLIHILEQGISVVVAPEGTRNDTQETLLPFQKGAFRLSIDTQVPILPMAVLGADRIMRRGSLLLSPGKVSIYFSDPIIPPIPSESALQTFTEKCRNRLEAMLLTHE